MDPSTTPEIFGKIDESEIEKIKFKFFSEIKLKFKYLRNR